MTIRVSLPGLRSMGWPLRHTTTLYVLGLVSDCNDAPLSTRMPTIT
jgi:hypothetical protein